MVSVMVRVRVMARVRVMLTEGPADTRKFDGQGQD